MARYHYACREPRCDNEFYIHEPMSSSPLRLCKICGTENLERVIYAATAFIKGEAKTIGLLAERNYDGLSSMQKSESKALEEENNTAVRREVAKSMGVDPNTPAPPPLNKKLLNLSAKQKVDYIQTGKLP